MPLKAKLTSPSGVFCGSDTLHTAHGLDVKDGQLNANHPTLKTHGAASFKQEQSVERIKCAQPATGSKAPMDDLSSGADTLLGSNPL